ncbi:MAG: amidohydrolase family protein, partial [Actinomycetota bacterium]
VDAHCHAEQEAWRPESWWMAVSERGAEIMDAPAQVLREMVVPALWDPDGSAQLAAMDEAGLDVAVMFPFDWSLEERLGRPETGWRQQNEWYADLADRHPDRVRWGFGVDPRQDGALEAFTEAVRDRGAVCLKLHPGGGWRMDDAVAHPFLERAGQLGVPVVMHVGPLPAPLDSSNAAPELLDAVAGGFPDLPIQAAHTGNTEWPAVVRVAERRANVYCDLSGWQVSLQEGPDALTAKVRRVLDAVGPDRVMWGTDAPYLRPIAPDSAWIDAFAGAPEGTFTADEVEAALGGTASRFFGLAREPGR